MKKWLQKRLSVVNLKQVLGVNLAGLAFAVGVVGPQTTEAISAWEVMREVPTVTVLPSETTYQWPLVTFGYSQGYRSGHPAVDLTAPQGTPVYPIADGEVEWTQSDAYGYGKHVFVKQSENVQTLYAHLAAIYVSPGQSVEKTTALGEVGHTGWATGNHVHMELYLDGRPVNPREILPEIR